MITERSHTERKAYSYLPWQKQTLKITDLNCHSYKNASVSSESGQTWYNETQADTEKLKIQ